MIKTTCQLLLLAILLAAALPAQNLIRNGDAEYVNHFPWSHNLYGPNVVTLAQIPKEGVGGSKCLMIEGKVPRGTRFWFQDIAGIKGNTRINLSVMVRTENVSSLVWISMFAKKGIRGALAHATTRTSLRLAGTADWKKVSLEMVVPEGTDKVVVQANLQGKGKVYFDNFVLLASGGESGKASGEEKPTTSAKRKKPQTAAYLLSTEIEIKARSNEKRGKVYIYLQGREETQIPYFCKIEAFPADGINSMKVIRKGRSGPPFIELKLKSLKANEKIKLKMKGKVLVLPRTTAPVLPEKEPAKAKLPSFCKKYLTATTIMKPLVDQGQKILAGLKPGDAPKALLNNLFGAVQKTPHPALTMAYILRTSKRPVRLLSGLTPGAGQVAPILAMDIWFHGANWIRVIPATGVIMPNSDEFILIRPLDRGSEGRFSQFMDKLPRNAFIDCSGRISLSCAKGKKAPCQCSQSLALPIPKPDLRKRLVEALSDNWERWLKAMEKGNNDPKAVFAGEAAAQTDDFEEAIRILNGI